jgi:hypothetical protein
MLCCTLVYVQSVKGDIRFFLPSFQLNPYSNSGFNSGGSGVAGTGIADYGRATSGGVAGSGCILEGSGNMAVASCGQASKRRLQQTGTGERRGDGWNAVLCCSVLGYNPVMQM